MTRVGVLGGCFDPPHVAHMIHAMLVKELFELDLMIFVPSASPPHKTVSTKFEDRVNMLLLALNGFPGFEVSTVEKEEGLAYTVDTLTHLKRRYDNSKFYLIIGRDEFDNLKTWKDPEGIMTLSEMIVLPRNGTSGGDSRKGIHNPPLPLIDISSSSIRERLKEGKSVRYMLPPKVEDYIREKKIY